MMNRLTALSFAMALGLCTAVSAETVTLVPPGTVIPYGQSGEYTFKAPTGYRSARLHIAIRMDCADCAGSTHVLRLRLNDRPVMGALDRAHFRLLNKPLMGKMAGGTEIPWVRDADWRVAYAPDFTILDTPEAGSAQIVNGSGYLLVLDVTDLLPPGADNRLVMQHMGQALNLRSYYPQLKPSLDFVLNELTVEFSQEPPVVGTARAEETFSCDRVMVQPPATADVRKIVTLGEGGALRIALPGLPLQLISRFSYPGGGFNTLGAKPEGQPEWRVQCRRAGDDLFVDATAKEYRLERHARLAKDHIEVLDRLTNLTNQDLALAFDNRLVSEGPALSEAWLGGNPDPAVSTFKAMENATVFVAGEKAGCGLLAWDDVYRVQAMLFFDQGAGARSDTFALAPKASYDVRYRVYPVLRPDYYDFINLARRDLDVNFTVPGGFQFGLAQPNDEAYRENAATRGLKFMSSGVWMDNNAAVKCYHGEHMLQAAAMQQQLRTRCDQIRRVIPALAGERMVKSLVYIHSFINTDPDGPQKHRDAWITNADGTQYENPEYTKMCGIPFMYNYPALNPENSYVAAMKRVIDMVLDKDKIGADGVYWDELEWISTPYTYDRWDGHSAFQDEQHRIKRKFAYVQLVSLEAKVQLIKYIQSKGGLLIGNSCAMTNTLTQLHFPRFVETAAGWYPARSHLYSPISLGDHLTVKDFPGLLADIRQKLMWGSLYYYYAAPKQPYGTITQHMFPLTPVELHRGWLLGKERVLTAVPGTFTLGDAAPVRVYWYDAAGKLTENKGQERVANGRRLVRLALGDEEMAVIERVAQ